MTAFALIIIALLVAVPATLWFLLADERKDDYRRNRTLVALALCFVNLLILAAIAWDALRP